MHKETTDGGSKRTNVKGRSVDGAEVTKRRSLSFMVKHGLLMGTSEAPRIFSWSCDKTFKRWKSTNQTSLLMLLSVPPDHTTESAKDVILNNAASLDRTLAEVRYQQNLRKLETVPSIRM